MCCSLLVRSQLITDITATRNWPLEPSATFHFRNQFSNSCDDLLPMSIGRILASYAQCTSASCQECAQIRDCQFILCEPILAAVEHSVVPSDGLPQAKCIMPGVCSD